MNTVTPIGLGGPAAPFAAVAGPTLAATDPAALSMTVPTRDDAMADLSTLSGTVNLLAAAANGGGGSSAASEQLTLPPLPQMPAPKAPAAVPTDDHGVSNVVFSDADVSGDLIH